MRTHVRVEQNRSNVYIDWCLSCWALLVCCYHWSFLSYLVILLHEGFGSSKRQLQCMSEVLKHGNQDKGIQ